MIEHRIRTIFERRSARDAAGMLEYAADDIVYKVCGDWQLYPFRTTREGKAEVAKMLRELDMRYENLGSVFHEFLVDGDRAAFHRTATLRNRGTGETYAIDFCDFARFRDGLVIEFSEYADTAALAKLEGYPV